jgi:hypothetical protein
MESHDLRLEDLHEKVRGLEQDLKDYRDREHGAGLESMKSSQTAARTEPMRDEELEAELGPKSSLRRKDLSQGVQTIRTEPAIPPVSMPFYPSFSSPPGPQSFPGFSMPFNTSGPSPFQSLPWWLLQQQDPDQRRKARVLVLEQSKILEDILAKMRQRSLSSSMRLPSVREVVTTARDEEREELELRLRQLERENRRLISEEKTSPPRMDLRLRSESRDLQEQIRAKDEQLDQLRREKEELEQELEASKARQIQLEADLEQSQAQISSLEAKNAQSTSKPEPSSSALKAQVEKLTQENSNLTTSYISLQRNYDQLILDRHGFGRVSEKNYRRQIDGQAVYLDSPEPRRSVSQAPPPVKQISDSQTRIQKLEYELMTLQRDKQRVLSELDRLPEVARSAATIRKRNDCERELSIMETNINSIKQKLRQFTRLN